MDCLNQSSCDLRPADVKSSPYTAVVMSRSLCTKTHWEALPRSKPRSCTRNSENSVCQPFAAGRVPYMWTSTFPHIPRSRAGSSAGSSTYTGLSSLTFALKYARLMSMTDTCVLSSDLGSLTCLAWPSMSVAALDKTLRIASNGGVGEKMLSSQGLLISRATSLDL